MPTNYHTPIVAGTAGTVASVNTVASSLDDGITKLHNGTTPFDGITVDGTGVAAVALASGVLALPAISTRPYYIISSETGSADDLTSITGGYAGRIIILQAASGHTITVKYGAGLLLSAGEIVLDSEYKTLTLIRVGSAFQELGDYGRLSLFQEQSATQMRAHSLMLPAYSVRNTVISGLTQKRLAVVPSGEARSSWSIRCQGGTTHLSGVTATVSGTGAASNDDIDVFNAYPSAASAGALAGVASANFTQWRLNHYPVFAGRIQTGSDLTTQRIYVGLNAAAVPNSDTLANSFVGFRWSSVAGDAGWMPVSYNGSQTLGAVMTPAVVASTVYDFRIRCTPSAVYITITIAGIEYTETIAALPSASSDLGFACNLVASAAAARTLKIARLYGESGGG